MTEPEYVRRIHAQSRGFIILFEIAAGFLTLYALVDLVFQRGGGYDWWDVLGGLGIMGFGALLYLVGRGIFKFVGDNYPHG